MIVFDTEATGLLPSSNAPLSEYPHLVEFAAIKLDPDLIELDRIEFLVKPPIALPAKFIEITGITEHRIEHASSFPLHFGALSNFFLGEDTIVAHNVSYDETVLEAEFKRIGKERCFPWPMYHICTVEATRDMEGVRKGKSGRFKLSELYLTLTGEKLTTAHRAMDDVETLVKCVRVLRERCWI